MKNSRRSFIKSSSLLIAGTMAFSNEIFAAKRRKQIVGIQLYSVRDDMKKDPLGTLNKLAAMGYTAVEHANYVNRKFYGYTATEFKKILDNLSMKMPSGHTVLAPHHWNKEKKEFTDSWKQTVEDAAILGQQHVISPSLDKNARNTYDGILRYMDVFNKSGELCKKWGIKFGYHNHDFEFSEKLNGITLYDLILKNTDPALVIQQLDTGNLYNGGTTAEKIIKKYPGRFESLHVKDVIKITATEKYESTIIGNGVADLKQNLNFIKKTGGTKYLIIEQEAYQGISPMQCAKENLRVMKSWGY